MTSTTALKGKDHNFVPCDRLCGSTCYKKYRSTNSWRNIMIKVNLHDADYLTLKVMVALVPHVRHVPHV